MGGLLRICRRLVEGRLHGLVKAGLNERELAQGIDGGEALG